MLVSETHTVGGAEISYTLHFDEEEGGWHFHHFCLPYEYISMKSLEIMEEHIFGVSLAEIDTVAIEQLAVVYSVPALKIGADIIRKEQSPRGHS